MAESAADWLNARLLLAQMLAIAIKYERSAIFRRLLSIPLHGGT